MERLTVFFIEPLFQTDDDRVFVSADGQIDHMGLIIVAYQLLGDLDGSFFPLYQLMVIRNDKGKDGTFMIQFFLEHTKAVFDQAKAGDLADAWGFSDVIQGKEISSYIFHWIGSFPDFELVTDRYQYVFNFGRKLYLEIVFLRGKWWTEGKLQAEFTRTKMKRKQIVQVDEKIL